MTDNILLIDNYDSFVHNLARYFVRLGQGTQVVRNDRLDVTTVRALKPAAVVLSPGPCTPKEAGCSLDMVRELHREIPMLGVCLGHQAICAALGGVVSRAPEPVHGRSSPVHHDSTGLFEGVPNPMTACRYHSLTVSHASLPGCLEATARTSDRVLMSVAHREFPVYGVQFHPESVETESGYQVLANFLRLSGLQPTTPTPSISDERHEPSPAPLETPETPVTF